MMGMKMCCLVGGQTQTHLKNAFESTSYKYKHAGKRYDNNISIHVFPQPWYISGREVGQLIHIHTSGVGKGSL